MFSIYMYHTHYTLNMICNHECIHVPFTTTSVITQYGLTVLMKAASEGYTEVVVKLVKAKANLDLQNNVCHYSVYTCISESVDSLCRDGADARIT